MTSASKVPLPKLKMINKMIDADPIPANHDQYDRTVKSTSTNWHEKYAVTMLTGINRNVSLVRSKVTRVRRSTERDSLIAIKLKFCRDISSLLLVLGLRCYSPS